MSANYAACAWQNGWFGLATLGKTLNLQVLQLWALNKRSSMYQLFNQVFRFLPRMRRVAPVNGVAHNLLERAEARAGRNPFQAQELRRAAFAYLSVVR